MKKSRLCALALCFALVLALCGCASYGQKPQQTIEILTPQTAKSLLLYDVDNQTPVCGYENMTRVPSGGFNMMVTAFLALDSLDPQEVVVNETIGSASLPAGTRNQSIRMREKMTVKDLAACVLLESAHDAAAVLAVRTAGSQEAFVERMNQWAADLGCEDTRFGDVSGLDSEASYTTAMDLVTMVSAALENETFRELFQAKDYQVPPTNSAKERQLFTSNYMMSKEIIPEFYDERVTGGMAGYRDDTGASLICTVQGDRSYIAVVLGAKRVLKDDGWRVERFGNFEEMTALLKYAD